MLLSIVIPTKNRYETLIPLLDELSKFSGEEMEVVVQDNSDDNSKMHSKFDKYKGNNIHYFYTNEWLSVVDNCDRAILNSSGEYVCFIGDDDAITPEIIEVAKMMDEKGIDSCGCHCAFYRWPTALGVNQNSFEYYQRNPILSSSNMNKLLKNCMKNGIQNKEGFPCVYHGIAKRTVLNKIFEMSGSFFPGPSPDMANAFSMALFVQNHVNIAIPFIIDGYSKASTGHASETKKHVGKLEDQTFLPKDTIDSWDDMLPKIWLPNTIWPQSGIQALKRCGREDLLNQVNYNAIYIKISVMYPEFKEMCKELRKRQNNQSYYLWTYFTVACNYLRNRMKKKKKGILLNREMSIGDAIFMSSKLIAESKMLEKLRSALGNGDW